MTDTKVTGHLHFWTVNKPRKCWFEYHLIVDNKDRIAVGAFGDYRIQAARNAGKLVKERYDFIPEIPPL